MMARPRKYHLWFPLPLVLAVLSSGASLTQQPVGEYVSITTSRVGNSDFERAQHEPFKSNAATALAFEDLSFLESSYIKFDRKQNTRLWPFLFTGITRSPPVSRATV
jgi:hypothetical protein